MAISAKSFIQYNSSLLQYVRKIKSITLNFGPQHPAAHGILRIVLQLNGEFINRVDTQFGYLHRGVEKLFESKNFIQNLPYFDRFDYVANLFQEHAYCIAIEKMLSFKKCINIFLNYTRTIFDELSRILNHLLTLSATSLDVGAMGSIFWAFEERERILEFYERISGARMHTALYRPFFFDWTTLTSAFFLDLSRFLLKCGKSVCSSFLGLLNNKVLKSRLSFVGCIQSSKVNNYAISGLISRSCGIKDDLRFLKVNAYGSYWYMSFRTFIGKRGDNYDRFLIRIKEVLESFRIISQALIFLNSNFFSNKFSELSLRNLSFIFSVKLSLHIISNFILFSNNVSDLVVLDSEFKDRSSLKFNNKNFLFSNFYNFFNVRGKFSSMEGVISHFKNYSENFIITPGISFQSIESPKGYLGVFLMSDGSNKPFRLKLRTPVAHNMNIIPSLCSGLMLADFVATFCSLDIVLGEIDR